VSEGGAERSRAGACWRNPDRSEIAEECQRDPQLVLEAPHTTRVSRLDEVTAARKPVLRWKPKQQPAAAD